VRETRTIHLKGIVFMKTISNQPQEWKLVSLRECPTPAEMQICDGPEQAAKYWIAHVVTHPCQRGRTFCDRTSPKLRSMRAFLCIPNNNEPVTIISLFFGTLS